MRFRADRDTELELNKCPHILVGGCTGSGKSYLMKSMLSDILLDNEDARVFVVDPKCVDYQFITNRKEFLWDGLDNIENAMVKRSWLRKGVCLLTRDQIESGFLERLLEWMVERMNTRYADMMDRGIVLWDGYPIILVLDELADVIYYDRDGQRNIERKGSRGNIERLLVKIATLGRAAKVHLILGTQRPDATILSGQLRANIPTRICLKVNNDMERRIILGIGNKELEGKWGVRGERVLYYDGKYSKLVRELK